MKRIKTKLKPLIRRLIKGKPLLKVYSHPRSGTHFLEAFIAENFYRNKNLKVNKVDWGHWSNRQVNKNGNPYGRLFGSHTHLPVKDKYHGPKIYIVRDGRAVAYSIWKTPNFINENIKHLSFSEILNTKIDWIGTPARKSEPKFTILEHWYNHVKSWEDYIKNNENILLIRYEDLKNQPYECYLLIHDFYFKEKSIIDKKEINPIVAPIGLLPNQAITDSWKEVFTKKDLELYEKILDKGLDSYKF